MIPTATPTSIMAFCSQPGNNNEDHPPQPLNQEAAIGLFTAINRAVTDQQHLAHLDREIADLNQRRTDTNDRIDDIDREITKRAEIPRIVYLVSKIALRSIGPLVYHVALDIKEITPQAFLTGLAVTHIALTAINKLFNSDF